MNRFWAKATLRSALALPYILGNWAMAEGTNADVDTLDVAELGRLCPAPLQGVSGECRNALDGRYSSQRVPFFAPYADPGDSVRWVPALLGPAILWRDIFEDPGSLRERTEDALGRPECVLPRGIVRQNLRDSCDADAMFRLSMLFDACVPLRVRDNSFIRGWQPSEVLGERLLYLGWRLHRCRAVPQEIFALLPATRVRPEYRPWNRSQGSALRLAAARLGDVRASAWSIGANADINAAVAAEPVAAYVRRAGKAYMDGDRDGLYLPYLLAARALDARRARPHFDWRGLQGAFAADERAAARPLADRLLSEGWRPLPERGTEPEPHPTAVYASERGIWIDSEGRERMTLEDGTVLTFTSNHGGFLDRCGRRGRELGFIPPLGADTRSPAGELANVSDRAVSREPVWRWTDDKGRECALAADGSVVHPSIFD